MHKFKFKQLIKCQSATYFNKNVFFATLNYQIHISICIYINHIHILSTFVLLLIPILFHLKPFTDRLLYISQF